MIFFPVNLKINIFVLLLSHIYSYRVGKQNKLILRVAAGWLAAYLGGRGVGGQESNDCEGLLFLITGGSEVHLLTCCRHRCRGHT